MTSPTGKSQRDNEIYSHEFFDEPNNQVRKFVKIVQTDGETLFVDQKPRGTVNYTYNEVSGIASGVETKINEYLVPIGKGFDSCNVLCSGDNITRFIVKVDGDNIKSKRTWWSDFNAEFKLNNLEFNAGERIEIFAINRGVKVSDYESTIMGNVYDV